MLQAETCDQEHRTLSYPILLVHVPLNIIRSISKFDEICIRYVKENKESLHIPIGLRCLVLYKLFVK